MLYECNKIAKQQMTTQKGRDPLQCKRLRFYLS
jgi:hypothetical protein